MCYKFGKPKSDAATRCLFVANCSPALGVPLEKLHAVLSRYGPVETILPSSSSASHLFALFDSAEAAAQALQDLDGVACAELNERILKVQFAAFQLNKAVVSKQVFLDAASAGVPGLQLHCNFVSEAEERRLLQYIDSQPWVLLAKRRVQHYGYKFEYVTRNVNSNTFLGAMPAVFQDVVERLQALEGVPKLDQMTVNEYPPGVGLAPHIDTHSAFTGSILSLSLAGPAVMEMRLGLEQRPVFLPPRSVLVMGGDARYCWQHYIPHRKSDLVNGEVVHRAKRRVSLTFRQARGFPCDCAHPEFCDSQQASLPPTRLAMLQEASSTEIQ